MVIDVSNPLNTEFLYGYADPSPTGISVVDTAAYLIDQGGILKIISVPECYEICKCPDDTVKPTGCISGMVIDNADKGLEGKRVILTRILPSTPEVKKSAKTDSNGCYNFKNLRKGTYKVRMKECVGGSSQSVVIKGDKQVNDIDFTCQ